MSEEIKTEEAGTDNNQEEKNRKKSIVTSFMDGAKEGFYIGIENILMAMVGLRYNQVPGTYGPRKSDWKGICSGNGNFWPAGRGGNCVNVAFFAKAAGAATAANLYAAGTINAAQATILVVPCMLMGTLVGHYARIVL